MCSTRNTDSFYGFKNRLPDNSSTRARFAVKIIEYENS